MIEAPAIARVESKTRPKTRTTETRTTETRTTETRTTETGTTEDRTTETRSETRTTYDHTATIAIPAGLRQRHRA